MTMLMNSVFDLPDVFRQLDSLRRGFENTLSCGSSAAAAFPPVNLYVNQDGAVITAEMPGVDPDGLDISAVADSMTITGQRQTAEEEEGQNWHRRERRCGRFSRTVQLPFRVEGDRVTARYRDGVLEVTAPRPESDKPRKVKVEA